jgi:hypothetical protein
MGPTQRRKGCQRAPLVGLDWDEQWSRSCFSSGGSRSFWSVLVRCSSCFATVHFVLAAIDGSYATHTPYVDLHSNLRLAPIWVERGTKIETGASFSLNLSANFAALSGESGLLFDCGLPGFDDGDCRNKFLSTAARRPTSGNGGSFGSTKPDDIASRYSRSTGRSIPF